MQGGEVVGNESHMIEQWKDTVYRLAYARMGNKADADDITQEVFLRYLKAQPEFENDEHAKAWFLRVTLNRCNSFFRKAFRRHTVPLYKDFPGESSISLESLDIDRAMKQLPGKYRTVIHLYYFEEMTTVQMAELLEIKESSVRMRLTRARRQLKEILGEDYYV